MSFLPRVFRRYLARLRFPQLFGLAAVLFAVNVFVADPLPFVDEALLLVASLILGRLREDEVAEREEGGNSPRELGGRGRREVEDGGNP